MIETIRHALRRVRHTPSMSAAAILCIGLGAAATTTVATLISATLLRPVPFPEADRLVRIWFEEPGVNPRVSLSIPEIADFGAMTSFDALLGTARVRVVARLADGVERMRGEGVSPLYFETLGVRPALGRVLGPEDHDPGAPPVVVLSHGTWMRRYGGDASVVGRPFRTERATYTIVGVADRWFDGTVEDDIVEFFIPVRQYEPRALITNRNARPVWAIGRLKPGATIASARAEAAAVRARLADAYPDTYRQWHARVEPFGENWRESLRGGGALMFGAAALLLLIAAINVGCLLLARALDRRRELAIRAAIGASRGRLTMELAAEAFVLVAGGGVVGMLAGPWLLDGFLALSPPGRFTLPRYISMETDGVTLALTFLVLAVAALVAGTVPALLGRNVAPGDVLREGGRGLMGRRVERRWGALLIASETALTLVLLVAGALLVRSYGALSSADVGFARDRIVRLAVTLSPADAGPRDHLPAVYDRLRRELEQVPGAERVGLVSPTLPPYDGYRSRVRLEGVELPHAPDGLDAGVHLSDDGLLPMLGARLVSGRDVRPSDGGDAPPVVVISRSLAALLGGPDRAIGRQVRIAGRDAAMPNGSFRVVGVAENVAYDGLAEGDTRRLIRDGAGRHDVYVPLVRFPAAVVSIGAWTSGDPAALIEPLRREIARIAPSSAVHWTGAMDDELALEYAPARFYAVLVAVFSGSALILTSIGLFALLSNIAARRASEMALRLALGATRGSTVRLLLAAVLAPLGAGVVAGLGIAALVARAMSSLLFGLEPFDLVTFAGAGGAIALVSALAALVPAKRIAAVDPIAALRAE